MLQLTFCNKAHLIVVGLSLAIQCQNTVAVQYIGLHLISIGISKYGISVLPPRI